MATERLVIRKQHHPWRRLVWSVLGAVVAAATVLGAYRVGVIRGVGGAEEAVAERQSLHRQVRAMEEELTTLRNDFARLQSAQRIDEEAHERVRATLSRVQQQNLELREELQFYRNIVAPSQNAPGLQVQRFVLEPAIGRGQYRYKLTLIHLQEAKNRQNVARGRIELYVDGSVEEQQQRLALAELVPSGNAELSYAIKYFKHFEGELQLPEGFQPYSAVVEVIPRGAAEPAVEKRIQWPAVAPG